MVSIYSNDMIFGSMSYLLVIILSNQPYIINPNALTIGNNRLTPASPIRPQIYISVTILHKSISIYLDQLMSLATWINWNFKINLDDL